MLSKLLVAEDRTTLLDSLSEALASGDRCFMLICCSAEDMAKQFQKVPEQNASPEDGVAKLLRHYRIPVHREGYRQLQIAIPLFAMDSSMSFSKELYPMIAKEFGCTDGRAVEHAIRNAICDAWEHRAPGIWEAYFSDERPPTNKCFISTLAEQLK